MVEPMIHDYYNDNEMPTMVHVIDKMNEELEDLRKEKEEEIAELKKTITKLKKLVLLNDKFFKFNNVNESKYGLAEVFTPPNIAQHIFHIPFHLGN